MSDRPVYNLGSRVRFQFGCRRNMSKSTDLLSKESHFSFGKNWESYSNLITEAEIEEAVKGLRRLAGGDIQGKRFVDIGCGSGLHVLAALRLGASEVLAMDIDSDSVATTRRVLQKYAADKRWQVVEKSVFEIDPAALGQFDVVYSWGVLHHTGDMYRALRCAAALVAPGGRFIVALYRQTWFCWAWKIEKRWYAGAGPKAQKIFRSFYIALFRLAKGWTFKRYVNNYKTNRGMDYYHDVHDWLGGWPYESVSPARLDRFLTPLGLKQVQKFVHKGVPTGVFGSGCDEYLYRRS